MIKISKKVYKILLENQLNRRRAEISSKNGRDYADNTSFFILTPFNKLL